MRRIIEYAAREPVRVAALIVGLLQAAVLVGWVELSDSSIDTIATAVVAGVNFAAVLIGADVARGRVTPVGRDG